MSRHWVGPQADQIEDEEDAEISPKKLLEGVDRHERKFQPNIDLHLEVNLGIDLEPRFVAIGANLKGEVKYEMTALLNGTLTPFPWSYANTSRLSTYIVVHYLPVRSECKPIKQRIRHMKPG